MGKDTDRDLLEKIVDFIEDALTLIQTINDNKYVPHITTQPTDITAALDEVIYFTLTANNVKEYQWQYQNIGQTTWRNTTLNGYNTNSLRVVTTEARYGMLFRCVITGLDDSVIYSNEVTIIPPET